EAMRQLCRGPRHLLHGLDAIDVLEVDEGADVEATGRGMGIVGGGGPVCGDEVFDRTDVLGEVLDGYGHVFDHRDRFGVAPNTHQQTETGLADRPNIGLPLGIEDTERRLAQADTTLAEMGFKSIALRGELGLTLAVELDGENAGRVAVDEGDLA